MAQFGFSGGSFSAHWRGDLEWQLNSQNTGGNFSTISIQEYIQSDPGYSISATSNGNITVNGGQVASGSPFLNGSGINVEMCSWTGNVGHDVNGNCSITIGGSISTGFSGTGSGSGSFGWTLPRIPLAPSISSLSSSNVTSTAATLSGGISSNGHGTSSTLNYYYRLQGSGTWIYAGSGGSVNLSGLSPAKTYEYYMSAVNNNGDTANTGTQTFVTLSVPGIVSVISALI